MTGKLEENETQGSILICPKPSRIEKESDERDFSIPIDPPFSFVCIQPRSIAQDFMQRLHAFINIKQLLKKSDLSSHIYN